MRRSRTLAPKSKMLSPANNPAHSQSLLVDDKSPIPHREEIENGKLVKNAWKGLIVGALTGMVGGSAMDMASGARRMTAEVAHDVIDKAPSVAKAATHKAADMLHDADVSARVRDAAVHVGDSDVAKKAKRAVKQ